MKRQRDIARDVRGQRPRDFGDFERKYERGERRRRDRRDRQSARRELRNWKV